MRLGVRFDPRGLRPEIVLAAVVALEVFRSHQIKLILAHGTNGAHKRGSIHYSGNAIDIHWDKLWGDETKARLVEADLAQSLGPFYDVIWEGGNHFHVEFQPKEPANAYHFS